jgi:hypothetical protein
MPTLNRPLSEALASKIPLADNRCFQNAYWALRQLPPEAVLVIGFARIFDTTTRHAWLEIEESVVDPSWVGFSEEPTYQPVHRYTKAQVKKLRIFSLGRVHREPLFREWDDLGREENAST